MRYFLISYSYRTGFGSLWLSDNRMPSRKFIMEWLVTHSKVSNPIIMNIFEFQSKEDYDNFKEE